jgi:hypothetical protein
MLSSDLRFLGCTMIDERILRSKHVFEQSVWTLLRPQSWLVESYLLGMRGAGHTGAGSQLGWYHIMFLGGPQFLLIDSIGGDW